MLGLGMMMLAALLPACGGDVTEGSGGSGGSGGAVGNGGAGGSGGGTGDECTPDLKALASLNAPPLGFASTPSGPGTAVVAAVDPAGLDLTLGAGGSVLRFDWLGPDLTAHFQVGETVSIGIGTGWHYVTGATAGLATIVDFSFVPPATLPELPGNGPAIGFATQCTWVESGGGCGQPPATAAVLALEATWNGQTTTVPYDGTGEAGPWQIHNAGAVALPGYGSNDCAVEAAYQAAVTSLGPAAPPP